MTDDDLIEAIREAAGYALHREAARRVLDVVAPEIGRRAAAIARDACLVPPDGGAPTIDEASVCDEASRRILAAFPRPLPRNTDNDPMRETF